MIENKKSKKTKKDLTYIFSFDILIVLSTKKTQKNVKFQKNKKKSKKLLTSSKANDILLVLLRKRV